VQVLPSNGVNASLTRYVGLSCAHMGHGLLATARPYVVLPSAVLPSAVLPSAVLLSAVLPSTVLLLTCLTNKRGRGQGGCGQWGRAAQGPGSESGIRVWVSCLSCIHKNEG
jgi:hypothetical protein